MPNPRLFHFSEVGDIGVFRPRSVDVPSKRRSGDEWLNGPLIWTVDESRQGTYLFPRDCPRIVLWPETTTSTRDRDEWWGESTCSMIAYVERTWFGCIQDQVLFRYELTAATFQPTSDEWMWVSREPVEPIDVVRLDDLLGALKEQSVELRVVESLVPLRSVWKSTLHASGIRLRNAHGW